MSYKSTSEKGYKIAEGKQTPYINKMLADYRKAKKEINNILQKMYAGLSSIEPTKHFAEMIKFNRLGRIEKQISKVYKQNVTSATKSTINGLATVIEENYNRQMYVASWVSPLKPRPINQNLVLYSSTGNVGVWKKIQSETFEKIWGNPNIYSPQSGTLRELFSQNASRELSQILNTVTTGLKNGQGYDKTSREIRKIIGSYQKQEGVEKASGAMYKALRIARTEGQRVLNAGAMANAQQSLAQGITTEKMWVSSLDDRTRESHISLDGQKRRIDREFVSSVTGARGMAPGQMDQIGDNINCRCRMIELVEGLEPDTRSARNPETRKTELISFKNYNQWLESNNL